MLALAASAFVVLAAEPLYLLIDTAVVGHLGSTPLAGLGIGAALMALLTIVGAFVEYGTTARAARWFGAGRHEAAVNEGVQATWLALGIGVVVVLAGELLAGPLTVLLAGGHGATQSAAESWFRIAVIGMPGVLVVLAGNGWMRGVQRTREPVRIVLVANALSAVASPLLVYPAGLGLEGSAVANVAAQARPMASQLHQGGVPTVGDVTASLSRTQMPMFGTVSGLTTAVPVSQVLGSPVMDSLGAATLENARKGGRVTPRHSPNLKTINRGD